MIPQSTRDEFFIRYYRWATTDSEREYLNDFPFLRKIKSKAVFRFLDFVAMLPQKDKEKFRIACVKRFHLRAIELTQEFLNPDETSLIERYFNFILHESSHEKSKLASLPPFKFSFETNQRKFKSLLEKELEKIFGKADQAYGNSSWYYFMPVENWQLVTVVKPSKPPLYFQHILGTHSECLNEQINILSWMGITSMTCWDFMTNEDLEETSQTIPNLCLHFLKACSTLLDELSL